MQRWIRLLVSLAVAGLAAWLLAKRVGQGGGREAARLDRGVAVQGERGRIDPHGPSALSPESPLAIDAQIEQETATDLRIEVELASNVAFDSVVVHAARYDAAGDLEPGWREVVWTGKVERGASVRFESRVPLGGSPPERVQLHAQAVEGNGARHSATAILRPRNEAR